MTRRILFIGSFRGGKEQVYGGQNLACKLLLQSRAARSVSWVLLDTTQIFNPPPNLLRRLRSAVNRSLTLTYIMLFRKTDCLLAFSASGSSLVEKIFHILIYRILTRKPGILFFRGSGIWSYTNKKTWFFSMALRFPSIIFVQTVEAMDGLHTKFGVPKNKIKVQQNWIKLESKFKTTPNLRRPRIIYTGWIHKLKGVFELVNAFELVLEKVNDAQLILCGDGIHLPEIRDLVKAKNLTSSVRILGRLERTELLKHLKKADVFVLPSHGEGMSNSLLEAMALGIPCITASLSSAMRAESGASAALEFEAKSVFDLAQKINMCINDDELRLSLSSAATSYIENNHELEKQCDLFVDTLKSLIK